MKAAESQYVHNALAYRAQPYPGAVTVIACASNARRGIFRDWSTIAGSHLSTHTVPGTHDTYIKRFVEQTAGAVRTCLAQDVGRAQPLTSVRNAERVDHAG